MAYLNWYVEATEVGDDADAEYLDAAMASHDNLWHSAHTYSVATEDAIHAILGRSLEGRTLYTYIYTMLDIDTLLLGNLIGEIAELLVVCLVHVWEARTGREVLATQWMLWEEIDMVVDDHQVANLEIRVHTARSVAYEEGLDAQLIHYSFREGNLLHAVSLIEMEAAFHCHDILATQLTENQLAGMTFYCGNREVWYLAVWKLVTISYF